jgi:NTE family protein
MKKVCLALGSGGPRGLAHIGVLKVLEENNIEINMISGSSIGALVGGAYLSLGSIKEVEKLALSADMKLVLGLLFDPTLNLGFVKGKKVKKFIEDKIGNSDIENLPKPFFSVATDFSTGNPVVFKKGRLADVVRASISIPFIFQPIPYEGILLTDGGLSMQVPVSPLKGSGCDIVVAVNLVENAYDKKDYFVDGLVHSPVGIYRIVVNSIGILEINLARENCKHADIVIAPDVRNVGWDSFWKPKEVIRQGEIAMRNNLEQLLELIQ